MTVICDAIGVTRSNVLARLAGKLRKRRGRPPLPQADLITEIEAAIKEQSNWGYIRIWAHLHLGPFSAKSPC